MSTILLVFLRFLWFICDFFTSIFLWFSIKILAVSTMKSAKFCYFWYFSKHFVEKIQFFSLILKYIWLYYSFLPTYFARIFIIQYLPPPKISGNTNAYGKPLVGPCVKCSLPEKSFLMTGWDRPNNRIRKLSILMITYCWLKTNKLRKLSPIKCL